MIKDIPAVRPPWVHPVLLVVEDLYVPLSLHIYSALAHHLALPILFLVFVVSFPYPLVHLLTLCLVLLLVQLVFVVLSFDPLVDLFVPVLVPLLVLVLVLLLALALVPDLVLLVRVVLTSYHLCFLLACLLAHVA